jgi:predicted kinase
MTEKFIEYISEGVNDPGIFKAVFLAGGPGSGKSFMVGKTALSAFGLRLINSDQAFEAALAQAGMEPTPENIMTDKGQSIRSKAKYLTQKKLSLSVIGRLGLVIDGTGKDVAKIQRQVTTLKNIGYDVAMIFVNTDEETALERNKKRSRSLPDNIVKKMWKDVQNNIGAFQRMFRNEMIIVDNSSDSNVEANTLSAYRQIQQFVRAPVRNHKAREWITNAQKQAMREEALEELELLGERKYKVAQDPDIKDRDSSQPAHYHKGLKKSTKVKRDAQFQKQAKMRDDDPSAYKFAPGDKEKGGKLKQTKPSKYTKYVDKMMSEIIDEISEKCWDGYEQKGMKKKGNKIVPNCVKKEEAEERDSMTLPKIGKIRNVSKRVSKQRTKTKQFDKIKIDEEIELQEISMSDKIKAKTVYKDKYEKFAKLLVSKMRKDRLMHGGKLRHGAYYHAHELLRLYRDGEKLNSKILGDMVKEEYKYEWGTPEGTEHMKSVTPGETPKKKKKEETNESIYKSPAHARLQKHMDKIRQTAKYKADVRKLGGTPEKPGSQNMFVPTKKEEVNEEDGKQCGDGMYYCRQRKACVAIPEGYKDRGDGFIVRENVQDVLADIKKFWQLEDIDYSKPEISEPLDLTLTDEDIQDMMYQADHLTIDDMIELGMYSPDEVETFEIDPEDVHADVEVTEALTPLGRIKRRQAARRNKQRLKVARARAMRKSATPDKIKMRATRGARGMMYKRLLRGRDKSSLPPAEKARLEVMIKRFQPLIARLAVRMVPQMRKAELNRLKKRGSMTSQKAKKFVVKKGGSASKYKAKKFKIKKK